MSGDRRQAAVERVTDLFERDLIPLAEYNPLVERILATTSASELEVVLSALPVAAPLVLLCDGGVVKEVPLELPALTEVRCTSGVMKVDLSRTVFEEMVSDIEIECGGGVMLVIVPRGLDVQVGDRVNDGGVFKNKVRPGGGPQRVVVHVRNEGGVIKLRHPRRFWFTR